MHSFREVAKQEFVENVDVGNDDGVIVHEETDMGEEVDAANCCAAIIC